MTGLNLAPIGGWALMGWFDEPPSFGLSSKLLSLAAFARELDGVRDALVGYQRILIAVDPSRTSEIASALSESPPANSVEPIHRSHRVDVEYSGPDIDWAAAHLRITKRALIEAHSSSRYRVVALGSPRFVYLSPIADRLALPRLESPRARVPAGSVAIGGRQTGIYAVERPGGWRVIGTCAPLPDLDAGDEIMFIPR